MVLLLPAGLYQRLPDGIPPEVSVRNAQLWRTDHEWIQASLRADRMLWEHLDDNQRRQVLVPPYEFEVATRSGDVYSLCLNGLTRTVSGRFEGATWCIQLYGFPPGDAVLARKLLLESDEHAFVMEGVSSHPTVREYKGRLLAGSRSEPLFAAGGVVPGRIRVITGRLSGE